MAAQGLKDYLQRYVDKPSGGGDGGTAKLKKKKRKGKNKNNGGGGGGNAIGKGVIILDDDAVWHREQDDEDDPEEDGDGPTVIEDVEVKQMHRMESLKTHRPYLSMADDGSGWVTLKDHDRRGGADNSAPTRSPQGKSPHFSAKRKRNDSPDLSPPRNRNDSPDQSPPRRGKDCPDLSPPKRRKDFPDSSPPRRKRDTLDLSPPRRRHDSPAEDTSPVVSAKRKRMDSPDFSPPRRRKGPPDVPLGKGPSSDDLDPPRRSKFSSSGGGPDQEARDFSPPRKRKYSLDLSSPRRRHDFPPQRGDSGDVSTKRKGSDSPDLSPLRRRKGSVDLPPPRRSKILSSGDSRMRKEAQEILPPRKRRDSPESSLPRTSIIYPDLSLPRTRDSPHPELAFNDSSPPRKPQSLMAAANQNRREEDLSPPWKKGAARMSDGTFAGLEKISDRGVVSEAERKRAAEAKMLSELDPSLSGRGAETVFRDKRGRRLEGLEEMLRQQRGEKAKPAEQPLEWGKGLAQKKVSDQNLAELEAEKSKPFARYRDDAELDKSLRERSRWGDPMAHLVKPTTAEPVLEDLGAPEEMKASGFIVPQDIPKHSWLKRGITPPPNRYDIRPGRHWDGVGRSTGFEQGLFKQKNEKKARELEAYLWSVSDM